MDIKVQNNAMEQLLRKQTIIELTGMSNSTLYYMMNKGEFPKPVKLGARSVAWKRSEIEAWINSRERAMQSGEGIGDES